MNTPHPDAHQEPPTLSLKSGGWIILAACALSFVVLIWAVISQLSSARPIGDGSDISSYQFDITNLSVPPSVMAASGNARDFLHVYASPEVIPGTDILAYNQQRRRPWVVTGDRVIGIEVNGKARAYPVHCLNAHEIIQDSIDDQKFTVTYSPLADAPVVILPDPELGQRDFGVSGLLCNSGLVMYDRDSETPSLWSPLLGSSIAGPLVGTQVEQLPIVTICTWRDWLEQHPDTTVILPDPASTKRYKTFNYDRYFNDRSDSLKYPASPLPAKALAGTTLPRLKSRVVAITAGGVRQVWPLSLLVQAIENEGAKEGSIELMQAGVPLEFIVRKLPQSVYVRAKDGSDIQVQPMLFFAWWCKHPDSSEQELVRQLPPNAVVTPRAD